MANPAVSSSDAASNSSGMSQLKKLTEFEGNTGLKITTVIFYGSNYLSWSNAIDIALCGRGRIGFIDGSFPPPESTATDYAEWRMNDRLVMSWLINSIDTKLHSLFNFSILNSAELPPLNVVCARIQKEETRKKVFSSYQKEKGHDESSAFNSTTDPSANAAKRFINSRGASTKGHGGGRTGRTGILCEYCGKTGHPKEKCWILHPHLKQQFQKERNQNENSNAFSVSITDSATSSSSAIDELALRLLKHLKRSQEVQQSNNKSLKTPSEGTQLQSHSAFALHVQGIHCNQKNIWIIDSGANDHMTHNSSILTNVSQSENCFIQVANGAKIPVKGSGKIKFFQNSIDQDSLLVPKLSNNLLSISKLTKDLNCVAIFSANKVEFQDCLTRTKIGEGSLKNGLYVLEQCSNALAAHSELSSSDLWHLRLGHPSHSVLLQLFPKITSSKVVCDSCELAKNYRSSFVCSDSVYNECFQLVHSDVWSAPKSSYDSFSYFVTFIDHHSRSTWIYLLKHKHEVFSVFKEFHNLVRNQFDKKIKILRTDNGTKYMGGFKDYLKKFGIIHQTTCVYTPQQNGVAERKNRHLLNVARAMMFKMNVKKRFWSDAVLTACHLINRIPSATTSGLAPIEILLNKKPDLSYLRVFGCCCFVHVPAGKRDKLDKRAVKCIFLGYSRNQKGYRCFDPESGQRFISRDVRFIEDQAFFCNDKEYNSQGELFDQLSNSSLYPGSVNLFFDGAGHQLSADHEESADNTNSSPTDAINLRNFENCSSESELGSNGIHEQNQVSDSSESDSTNCSNDCDSTVQEQINIPGDINLKRSSRTKFQNCKLKEYETYCCAYPIENYISYANIKPSYQAYISKLDNLHEPTKFEDAVKIEAWRKAMNEELDALERNQTWTVVELPHNKKAIDSKWIYKIKQNADGSIERYKARLVSKCFTQTHGVDYGETFAPVAKMNTIRILVSVAINQGWIMEHMDVKNAFLQGNLQEEVYLNLPQGLKIHTPGKVCKLNKAIYGLKQSPRAWYVKLSGELMNLGFKKCYSDSSLFVLNKPEGKVIILVYVDDILITGSNKGMIDDLKLQLHNRFDIKDLGKLKYFLGVEFAYLSKGVFMGQRKYVLDLLKESGKLKSKPVSTLIETNFNVPKDSPLIADVHRFQRMVGRLIYLTITRPDITFAVSLISRAMHKPQEFHIQIMDRILRYLKTTLGKGILMRSNGNLFVHGFADASYAAKADLRKSTTGYCVFVGNNPVVWRPKKQSVVSRSSTEAEYRAMSSATSEIVWVRSVLQELQFNIPCPMNLFCDNVAAIHIATNPVFHERTKHIEVDCHFIRDKVGLLQPPILVVMNKPLMCLLRL
uniref:Retrotransposon 4 protein n=1 Tax=Hypericum perforatum TaxID=65561 RepID=D9ZHD9_HYPPE|nr:retrotransposon 4 protein [Hypericum perforatum]